MAADPDPQRSTTLTVSEPRSSRAKRATGIVRRLLGRRRKCDSGRKLVGSADGVVFMSTSTGRRRR
ncbi:hypothetical protein ACFQPA_10540 [Halomarina halobia]|uniref:Uncharacterized protein n=1 Tax=Halomarina halobia TaxID=3033386 RepID=A0ABD6ABD4_9EURY|nr:hypothetical protein [Halomarina sp. PSR21]